MSKATHTLTNHGRILLFLIIFATTALLLQSCLFRNTPFRPTFSRARDSAPEADEKVPRFAILVMTTSETSYDHIAFSNKHSYALRHGYALIWDFTPTFQYPKVWDKLNMSRDAITSAAGYDWIWMLDYDTLITNTSVRLEDVVEDSLTYAENVESKRREDVHMILSRDCEPLNLGSFFLRASSWTLDMIEHWRAGASMPNAETGELRNEQDVMRDMLVDNAFAVSDHSVLVPQNWFDAYPEELPCYDPRGGGEQKPWQPGMFVLHFAGARWWLKGQKDPIGTLVRQYVAAVTDR